MQLSYNMAKVIPQDRTLNSNGEFTSKQFSPTAVHLATCKHNANF